MRELNSGLTLIFAVSYFTLTMAVLLAGGGQRIRRWSALVLLLIGGLLFNSGTRPFGIPHSAGIWIAGLPRLLQAMGLGALTALIYIMPDGYFRSRRWRILAGLWTGWFVVWLVPLLPGTILDSMEWPPVLRPLPIILAVASGLLSLYLRHRDARPAERPALVLLLAGYGLTFFTLLIVWLAITSVDGWLAGRAIGISHLFSFTPYLLPWLALPAVTLVALSRRHAVEEARHEAMPVI